MQKAHDATYNTYWENLPSMATPIVAGQLNRNEQTVDTLDDRIISLDVLKGDKSMLLKSVGSTEVDVDPITLDEETGVFTIRLNNGTSYEIDTNLEKLAINFYYDNDPASQHYQQLVITLEDGTLQYVDLSALVNQYDFANSPTIGFTNIQGIISADIINGSVTDQKMQPNYLADITAQAQSGAQSAINASGFKLDSEAWAIGTRNGQAVPQSDPAYHNNSKYWASQANVTSLEALTDVYIDQPRDLQYLGYDATEEYFTLMDIPQADSTPVRLIVISEEGSEVVITKPDGDTVTPTHIQSGQWQADFFGASAYGTYQIDAVLGGDDAEVSVNVDDCKIYVIDDSHFHASIVVTYPTGATVSCVKTGEPTQYATSSPYTFVVHSLGEYTITGTRNGITEVQTVTITASEQVVNITLTILPDGSTITPTDDVQILLNCADIWDKSYTAISELIADDTSLLKVLTTDNAIDYLVRSTTFASAITADSDAMAMIGSYDYASDTLIADSTWLTAITGSTYIDSALNTSVPTMTSNTTPSGEAFASSSYVSSYPAWKAFDKDLTTFWLPSKNLTNQYVGYKFTRAIKCKVATLKQTNYTLTRSISSKIQGSNDGTTYTDISDAFAITSSNLNPTVVCDDSVAYKYLRFLAVDVYTVENNNPSMDELQFYGRENGGVQSWLRSGGITDKTYTTLAEVLADTTTLSALIANHDAVDYLVTAKALIDGIVADATAMSYIGLNNYCANTLLDDADWLSAICNSAYFESVLNFKVPSMTSNTTPSGECFASEEYSGYGAYKAFDGDNSTGWYAGAISSTNQRVGYDFNEAVKVLKVRVRPEFPSSTSRLKNINIQYSDDKSTWSGNNAFVVPNASQDNDYILTDIGNHRYWSMFVTDNYATYNIGCATLQFYGREDV